MRRRCAGKHPKHKPATPKNTPSTTQSERKHPKHDPIPLTSLPASGCEDPRPGTLPSLPRHSGSSKCDEYTVEDKRGWRPILLCRVMCGNSNYIEEAFPDAGVVVDSVVRGRTARVICGLPLSDGCVWKSRVWPARSALALRAQLCFWREKTMMRNGKERERRERKKQEKDGVSAPAPAR